MVLVGSRGDSATYVRSKKKACADVGIESFGRELPEDVSEEELLKVQILCRLTESLEWTSRGCDAIKFSPDLLCGALDSDTLI